MSERERCTSCNATRVTRSWRDRSQDPIFKYQTVATCLECGVSGDREDVCENIRLCDVCEEPMTYDSEVYISLDGVGLQGTDFRVHPLCVIQIVPKLITEMRASVTHVRGTGLINALDPSWDDFDLEGRKTKR